MPPMRLCSRDSSMRSVGECRYAGGGGSDAEALQLRIAARTSGLQPDLVEPQYVTVGLRTGALAHLVQRIDHGLEFLGQLGEYGGEHPATAVCRGLRQCAVGA